MADCPSINKCIFFNDKMENRPAMAAIYKARYCKGDNLKCARWLVACALGKENVPANLFPNMIETAEKLIQEKK